MCLEDLPNDAGIPGLWPFMKAAAELAADVQLALPPINAEALMQRFCSQLDLPKVSDVPLLPNSLP